MNDLQTRLNAEAEKSGRSLAELLRRATYITGDSLTTQAAPYLEFLWAIGGRLLTMQHFPGVTLVQGIPWMQGQRAAPPMAPTAVVCLGGNDSVPLDQFLWFVQGAVNILMGPEPGPYSPPVTRLFWVNFYSHNPALPGCNLGINNEKNSVLAYVLGRQESGRVTLLDWAGLVGRHPEWVLPDGVHYTADGAAQRAIFIAEAVTKAVP